MKMKNIGLELLRKIKEETIERWHKLGLLEGLTGHEDNLAELYQGKLVCEVYKENNKHFIPEISDLRVGYECEVQEIVSAISHCVDDIIRTDLTYDENWVKVRIGYPVYLNII